MLGYGFSYTGNRGGRAVVPAWVPRGANGRPVVAYASITKNRFWYRKVLPSFSSWMAALGLAVGNAQGVRTEYNALRGITKYNAGVLRPAYDPATGSLKGMRFWSDSSNLMFSTEDFTSNTVWSKGNGAITADVVASPDGAGTADLFTGTASPCSIRNSSALTVTSGATYQISWFVKRGNFDWLCLRAAVDIGVTNGISVWVNLATGTAGSTVVSGSGWSLARAVKVTALGDGWFRISYWVTTGGTTLTHQIRAAAGDTQLPSPDIGGGAGVGNMFYVWGAQITQGLSEAPYVQNTSTSAAAQAPADFLTITPVVKAGAPNLISNGEFAADVSGWTAAPVGTIAWRSPGYLRATSQGANQGRGQQQITNFAPGKVYRVRWDVIAGSTVGGRCFVSPDGGTANAIANVAATAGTTGTFYFIATQASLYVVLSCGSATNGLYADFDDVRVEECTYLGMDKPVPAGGLTIGLRMESNELTDGTSGLTGYPVLLGTDTNNYRLQIRGPSGTLTPTALLGDGTALDSYIPAVAQTRGTMFRCMLNTAAAAPPGSGFSTQGQDRVNIARAASVDPASPGGFIMLNADGVLDEILIDDAVWSNDDADMWVDAA